MNRDSSLDTWRALALKMEAEVGNAAVGVARAVRLINLAVFARGHVLLEGDVGIGKTTLLRAFARTGETLAVFFFNEVSRARPQVQALLLRAMAERSVTAFHREVRLPHLTVFADRNRVEKEETFELAGAARDRFMFEIQMAVPDDAAI